MSAVSRLSHLSLRTSLRLRTSAADLSHQAGHSSREGAGFPVNVRAA